LATGEWDVHAADRRPVPATFSRVTSHELDILDRQQVDELMDEVRPTHLLHLAWTGARPVYRSLENFRWVRGSLRLFEAFAQAGGQRVVALGSGAEYEWSDLDCSEASTPLASGTVYGVCKSSLFQLFEALCRETGLSGAWARPFFLFGPYENPERFVASVITSLLREEPARCTHGRQVRDFLYSRDLAAALVFVLEGDFQGPVNIGSGEGVSLSRIARTAAQRIGREELLELGALPAPEGEAERVVADVHRLRSVIGWSPSYSLELGIEETIDWWRHQLGS
jgi:nucleoside-diphosphate-sugar epimerase